MLPKSLILSFVGQLFVTFAVWAGTSILEGLVKDPNGHPIKGADVRIEAKNFSKIVKTDANGHYTCDGLGVGTYKVTLVVSGQVKASIVNAKTQSGKAAQLNFNLTGQTASAKKHTHMVYAPPSVDSRIGAGRSQDSSIGRESETVDLSQMAFEAPAFFAGRQFPESDGAIDTA